MMTILIHTHHNKIDEKKKNLTQLIQNLFSFGAHPIGVCIERSSIKIGD
jgi:hypothetical protein